MEYITITRAELTALLETNETLRNDLVEVLENAYAGFQPIADLSSILSGNPGQMVAKIGTIFQSSKNIGEKIKPNIDAVIGKMRIYTPHLITESDAQRTTEKPQ